MTTKQTKPRFQVIAWQRGSYGIQDTRYPIGTPGRLLGVGFRHKREAEKEARALNKQDRKREQEIQRLLSLPSNPYPVPQGYVGEKP